CRPPVVFGEQVNAAIGHGWWDLVSTDLESAAYAVAAAVLASASVGVTDIRHRLYFVGMANSPNVRSLDDEQPANGRATESVAERGLSVGMADTGSERRQQERGSAPRHEEANGREGWNGCEPDGDHLFASSGQVVGMADASSARCSRSEDGKATRG